MKRLTEELKRALAALAWADAGEMLSRPEKARILTDPGATVDEPALLPPARTRPASAGPGRKVALGLGRDLPEGVMSYVVSTCQRFGAHLTVLTLEDPASVSTQLAPYAQDLAAAGIRWDVVQLGPHPAEEVTRYLRDNPRIMFMVSSGVDDPSRALLGEDGRKPRPLPVPLVLVA